MESDKTQLLYIFNALKEYRDGSLDEGTDAYFEITGIMDMARNGCEEDCSILHQFQVLMDYRSVEGIDISFIEEIEELDLGGREFAEEVKRICEKQFDEVRADYLEEDFNILFEDSICSQSPGEGCSSYFSVVLNEKIRVGVLLDWFVESEQNCKNYGRITKFEVQEVEMYFQEEESESYGF